jgi:hypothetical protein
MISSRKDVRITFSAEDVKFMRLYLPYHKDYYGPAPLPFFKGEAGRGYAPEAINQYPEIACPLVVNLHKRLIVISINRILH